MQCPRCKCEMAVIKGYNAVENDDSPDKETKLYYVMVNKCKNKKCDYNEEVHQRVELELGAE